jgi:polyisoprenoid-binding protein YceI
VDPTSVFTGYTSDDTFKETHPDAVADTWDGELAQGWFQAGEHPEITFEATGIDVTGDNTGTVTGDLSFLGVTQPVTLDVVFNGTQTFPWNNGRETIGFSATGEITRSEFGLDRMVGPIGDTVELVIEAEFLEAAE